MPYVEDLCRGMDPPSEGESQLTVVDVYDIASDIGKEFERMIDEFGADAVIHLMPKVVAILEHLENFTSRYERENGHISELKSVIARLENEKMGKAEDRQRFEMELEQSEKNWREETKELLNLVAKLKEENRRLSLSLEEKDGEQVRSNANCPHEQDLKVLHRMKEVIDQQRDQLRGREKELEQNMTEMEALQSQLECLTQLNKDWRRKHKMTQTQIRLMIEEKAELQAQLQEQHRVMQVLKQNLGVAQKDKEDLAKAKSDNSNASNKSKVDENDPHLPRFTLHELKNILYEKNELKARVSELEDEIDFYKPKNQITHGSDDDDPPVQGPINKEPDDAPWKKQDSGIRKFFRGLFGDTQGNVRRSLSRVRCSIVPDSGTTLQ